MKFGLPDALRMTPKTKHNYHLDPLDLSPPTICITPPTDYLKPPGSPTGANSGIGLVHEQVTMNDPRLLQPDHACPEADPFTPTTETPFDKKPLIFSPLTPISPTRAGKPLPKSRVPPSPAQQPQGSVLRFLPGRSTRNATTAQRSQGVNTPKKDGTPVRNFFRHLSMTRLKPMPSAADPFRAVPSGTHVTAEGSAFRLQTPTILSASADQDKLHPSGDDDNVGILPDPAHASRTKPREDHNSEAEAEAEARSYHTATARLLANAALLFVCLLAFPWLLFYLCLAIIVIRSKIFAEVILDGFLRLKAALEPKESRISKDPESPAHIPTGNIAQDTSSAARVLESASGIQALADAPSVDAVAIAEIPTTTEACAVLQPRVPTESPRIGLRYSLDGTSRFHSIRGGVSSRPAPQRRNAYLTGADINFLPWPIRISIRDENDPPQDIPVNRHSTPSPLLTPASLLVDSPVENAQEKPTPARPARLSKTISIPSNIPTDFRQVSLLNFPASPSTGGIATRGSSHPADNNPTEPPQTAAPPRWWDSRADSVNVASPIDDSDPNRTRSLSGRVNQAEVAVARLHALFNANNHEQLLHMTKPGRLEIDRLIGSGSFGKVFRAMDLATGATYALKVVRVRNRQTGAALASEIQVLTDILKYERFFLMRMPEKKEIDVSWWLKDFRYVHILTEYCPGNLADNLPPDSTLNDLRIGMIASNILSGLHFLHTSLFVIHHDIKPENILIRADGCCVIADFGGAQYFDPCKGWVSGYRGVFTPGYTAPELFSESDGPCYYDYTVDYYALGVIMVELHHGRMNFRGDDDKPMILKHKHLELPKDHYSIIIPRHPIARRDAMYHIQKNMFEKSAITITSPKDQQPRPFSIGFRQQSEKTAQRYNLESRTWKRTSQMEAADEGPEMAEMAEERARLGEEMGYAEFYQCIEEHKLRMQMDPEYIVRQEEL